jgi:hypothetical protein
MPSSVFSTRSNGAAEREACAMTWEFPPQPLSDTTAHAQSLPSTMREVARMEAACDMKIQRGRRTSGGRGAWSDGVRSIGRGGEGEMRPRAELPVT